MYRAFIDKDAISPLGATYPALFAKLFLAWPAIMSLFANRDIRNKLFQKNKKKPKATSRNNILERVNMELIEMREVQQSENFSNYFQKLTITIN